MNAVLSAYPLTKGNALPFASGEQSIFLTLNELRLESPLKMVARLRSLRARAFHVVVQEPSERAVLALMLTLAAIAPVSEIEVHEVYASTRRQVGRMSAFFGAFGIVAATLAGRWAALRTRWLCNSLLHTAPQTFASTSGRKALYLKTNLMLGAKAGGSIGHIAGVANELIRRDPQSLVLAPERPPLLADSARFEPIHALETYGVPPEVNHFRFNARCVKQALPVMARESFSFIYQRLTLGNLAGVILSRRARIPLVLEYNGSEVWVSQNWGHKLKFAGLAQAIEDVCLRHAHRVVTVSSVLADELHARGVPKEKIVWYPNCIDPIMFNPDTRQRARASLRQRHGIADTDLVVLFIGTFGLWHGAETLAEAARQCLARPKEPGLPRLRFIFVGDGVRLAAVRAILQTAIERGDAILTGLVAQHEAPDYLAMADIFSSPHVPTTDGSKFFGSPTKLFEYMAMARPIVASELDQLGDVLRPAVRLESLGEAWKARGDETAILVEPGSAADIVAALEILRRRPEVRHSLAMAARKKALALYTWRQHVDVIVNAL